MFQQPDQQSLMTNIEQLYIEIRSAKKLQKEKENECLGED